MRFQDVASVVLLFGAFSCPAQTKSSIPAPPPLGDLFDVGGYRIHLYCTGTGSPTVLIAGAGYSFDWDLVQPEVARHTRVCAYDHSGIAWSDPGPPDSCLLRVGELHAALQEASVASPFVIVGHSLGALVSRLYAAKYPKDVSGMVLVDHASSLRAKTYVTSLPPPLIGNPVWKKSPSLVSGLSPRTVDSSELSSIPTLQDDLEWQKLPPAAYKLHQWADSQPNHQIEITKNQDLISECSSEVESATQNQIHPFGGKPLIVLNATDSPAAAARLALLSTNSKEVDVQDSSHLIMVDHPEAVTNMILKVVEAVREKQSLNH